MDAQRYHVTDGGEVWDTSARCALDECEIVDLLNSITEPPMSDERLRQEVAKDLFVRCAGQSEDVAMSKLMAEKCLEAADIFVAAQHPKEEADGSD